MFILIYGNSCICISSRYVRCYVQAKRSWGHTHVRTEHSVDLGSRLSRLRQSCSCWSWFRNLDCGGHCSTDTGIEHDRGRHFCQVGTRLLVLEDHMPHAVDWCRPRHHFRPGWMDYPSATFCRCHWTNNIGIDNGCASRSIELSFENRSSLDWGRHSSVFVGRGIPNCHCFQCCSNECNGQSRSVRTHS